MTPKSFKAWRTRLFGERGQTAAAEALGCSKTSIRAWERGFEYVLPTGGELQRRQERRVPVYIALAAAALEANLPPVA